MISSAVAGTYVLYKSSATAGKSSSYEDLVEYDRLLRGRTSPFQQKWTRAASSSTSIVVRVINILDFVRMVIDCIFRSEAGTMAFVRMIAPLAIGTRITEVSSYDGACGKRTFAAAKAFDAGDCRTNTARFNEQGIDVRWAVCTNLGRADGCGKISDVAAGHVEEGALYEVVAEVDHFTAGDQEERMFRFDFALRSGVSYDFHCQGECIVQNECPTGVRILLARVP